MGLHWEGVAKKGMVIFEDWLKQGGVIMGWAAVGRGYNGEWLQWGVDTAAIQLCRLGRIMFLRLWRRVGH